MKKKIALEGPINKCSDAQATGWRERAIAELGDVFSFHNPMDFDCRGKEGELRAALVRFDETGMASSDFALMDAEKPGWGTAVALQFLYAMHKPVFAVCSSDTPSPWLVDRSTRIFKTWDEAFAHLRTLA